MKASTDTIVRTVVLILALINQCLVVAGISPLPIDDEQLTEVISTLVTMAAALWAWWKNNSLTKAAITADSIKTAIKSGTLSVEKVNDLVKSVE